MTFEQFRRENIASIEEELDSLLTDFLRTFDTQTRLEPLISSFVSANKKGKRIRGLLILLGFILSGKKKSKEIITFSALYELIQTGLLIHDDIIDRSETRRGERSVYASYGSDHYAISQGISLGDLGFFFSEKVLSEIDLPGILQKKIFQELNLVLSQTAIGQMLDVSFSKPPFPTQDEILSMLYLKTAMYTFIGPMRLGIIASDRNPSEHIDLFGKNLGIAFQLQDDVLGVFGNESKTGKSTVSDIQEGKNTLLYHYACSHTDEETREWLEKIYGNDSLTKNDVIHIKNIFEDSGARKHVEDLAQQYFTKAENIVRDITNDNNLKTLLISFIQFIKLREH